LPGGVFVVHFVAENLRAAPILSLTRTEKVDPQDIRSLLLCSTRLPQHKVSKKDIRSSQHKAASHNFRLSRFVGLLE